MSGPQGAVRLECGCTLASPETHGEDIYVGGKVTCPACRASFRITSIHWPDGEPVTPWADPWHDVTGDIRAIREGDSDDT